MADLDVNPEQSFSGQAAVLVPLMQKGQEWHVLLTRRADTLRHHSGEVAFPGGMWEPGDQFPHMTALRESEEEIGLPRDQVKVLGCLQEMPTRRQTRVMPVVGIMPSEITLQQNVEEIADIFTVPIAFFQNDQRYRTDIFQRQQGDCIKRHWVPAYQYDEYLIWGFTAAVLVQLLSRCFDTPLQRENSAPEKIW